MSFRILPDEPVERAIRRIARERIDKAIGEVEDPDRVAAVHAVRKRCKQIRGVLRLVRPQLQETYDIENAWYRDTARLVSHIRDSQSIVASFDDLLASLERPLDRAASGAMRRYLTRLRKRAHDQDELRKRLAELRDRLRQGKARLVSWRLADGGFDAVDDGLRTTYSRGRKAMKAVRGSPCTETIHEWRKRVKDHGYHVRLLRCVWEGAMKARQREVDELSDLLGDDHDLSVLRDTLLSGPHELGGPKTLQTVLGLIGQRQAELRTQAEVLGARIFAEKPRRFAERIESYWDAWRRTADASAGPRLASRGRRAAADRSDSIGSSGAGLRT